MKLIDKLAREALTAFDTRAFSERQKNGYLLGFEAGFAKASELIAAEINKYRAEMQKFSDERYYLGLGDANHWGYYVVAVDKIVERIACVGE